MTRQTQSPYTPGGSPSGSAFGTTSGFSAFSIGSELYGSIVQPEIRAALYSIKRTVGDINMKGTMSGGAGFDSAGPLAKSVEDCADIMDVLLLGRDFNSHLVKSWDGPKVAYLDYKTWQFADWVCKPVPACDDEHEHAMLNAMTKVDRCGEVSYNAPLLMPGAITEKYGTAQIGDLLTHDLAFSFKRFLALFNKPGLQAAQDFLDFNNKHADLELPPGKIHLQRTMGNPLSYFPKKPSQSLLESALEDTMSHEKYLHDLEYLRKSFRDAVEEYFKATGADVIMASGESYLTSMASAAGYPIASVPLGFSSYNGRPHGMEIMARNGEAEKTFEVISAWETLFPDVRKPPPSLEKAVKIDL